MCAFFSATSIFNIPACMISTARKLSNACWNDTHPAHGFVPQTDMWAVLKRDICLHMNNFLTQNDNI